MISLLKMPDWSAASLRCVLGCFSAVFLLGITVEAGSNEWPFYPPRSLPPPEVKNERRVRNEIDSFLLNTLEANGLSFAPETGRRTLVRRLYFDLIGLPPTPEQIEAFLKDDQPQAYERLVDALLEDERYGERWAKFWLDLARYADTAGYEGDPDLPHAWRYRDYVIDSLNRDKPYDQFIREQIAGDEFKEIMGAGELPLPEPEHVVAMTFLRLAPFTEPRGDETRHEMLSEMTSTVGSVFLGLTVGCAKCHDHKYDGISTRDFYRMKAFFNTVQLMPPERGDAYQIGGSLPASFYREGEAEWAEAKRVEIRSGLESFEALKTRLRVRAEAQKRSESDADSDEKEGEKLDLHAWIMDPENDSITSEERQRYEYLSHQAAFASQHLKRLEPRAMSLRHSFGPPYEPGVPVSRVMIRGEYDNPGEEVLAGFPSCITGHQEPADIRLDPFKRWPTRSRRMALAEWIASAENPMTARVMVNRLWMHHFGQGIVATPSDFGKLSGGPSHPELLDWLARKFVEEKWSVKAMHRIMLNSSAYRQSSTEFDRRGLDLDADNRWLGRFSPRRLEAEAIRDSVLFVSGRLNPEMYGLPIFPALPDGIEERVKYSKSKWATDTGPESRKRSIYIYQQRTLTMPFMQNFDSLVCEDTVPKRQKSVTPLQSLAMYNGRLVNEEAGHFAKRLIDEAPSDSTSRLDLAFQLALGRLPSPEERSSLEGVSTSAEGLNRLARILFNTSEFIYVD
jgi:hypothetical protein